MAIRLGVPRFDRRVDVAVDKTDRDGEGARGTTWDVLKIDDREAVNGPFSRMV